MKSSKYSIRTSDRRVFRRCLRKWDYQSSLRKNLTRDGSEQNIHFWFGSAIHFAMEDYHGYNKFEDPRRAFAAYYDAFDDDNKPLGAESYFNLGMDMLTYYLSWLPRHNDATGFETAWVMPNTYQLVEKGTEGSVPAVEISFYIPLHVYRIVEAHTMEPIGSFFFDGTDESVQSTVIDSPITIPADWKPSNDPDTVYNGVAGPHAYMDVKIIPLFYHGTIDRIVVDKYGRAWLLDYKTAKSADVAKLDTDDQVSAYLWAANRLFPFQVYGFVYLQLTKESAKPPKRLKDGTLSADKRQKTTYGLFRNALLEDYGEVNKAPNKLIDMLNHLAATEEPEGDRFIRWDFVKRSLAQLNNVTKHIYGELDMMLNPQLVCFPTPTRDCSWDCPFRDACIMEDADDQAGLAHFLKDYVERPHGEDGNHDEWRDGIAWPEIGADGKPILKSIEELSEDHVPLNPILNTEDESADTFKFYYEEDC